MAEPSDALRGRVLRASTDALPRTVAACKSLSDIPATGGGRVVPLWGLSRRSKAIAAAVAILVVGGLFTWSGRRANDAWWTGPAAAWGQEVVALLERAEGVTCRERTVFIMTDGARHESSTVRTLYVSRDSYRRDIFDADQLRETQWYTPDAADMLQTSVRFDLGSYSTVRHEGSFGDLRPVERMRLWVGLADVACRQLGREQIEGRECVGFEVRASQYGDNPDEWLDRIWFDVEAKLPVRMERERPAADGALLATIDIQDQFNWSPDLAADDLTPRIPEGFSAASPDAQGTEP